MVQLDLVLIKRLNKISKKKKLINQDFLKFIKLYEDKSDNEELIKYKLLPNDLLICEGGDVGRSAIWKENIEMYYQNALHRVRFFDRIEPEYFLIVLDYLKIFLELENQFRKLLQNPIFPYNKDYYKIVHFSDKFQLF